ncbi:MAG: YdcF family protein [Desulfuromonadales bacterium]|nr:YdcF family protein [Desulfuromonadales bacterium]
MKLYSFLLGTLAGLLLAALALALILRFLPNFLVVDHQPTPADAIVVLAGDTDGSRLRAALQLHDDRLAPQLLLVGRSSKAWEPTVKKLAPAVTLEGRAVTYIEGSTDTLTDAQLTLGHCRATPIRKLLVVTSPYHSRRTQFIFNDIYAGSGIEPTVISSGGYEKYVSPDAHWWADRRTLENAWLEFGKILYWELTPFMEFQGEGERLKESERAK